MGSAADTHRETSAGVARCAWSLPDAIRALPRIAQRVGFPRACNGPAGHFKGTAELSSVQVALFQLERLERRAVMLPTLSIKRHALRCESDDALHQ